MKVSQGVQEPWVKYSMILICDLNLTICPRKEVILHKRTLFHVLLKNWVILLKVAEEIHDLLDTSGDGWKLSMRCAF